MMRFWSIAVLCFLDLFRQTACKEVPIKNATFSNFWFEQPFLLDGAGEQWKLVEGEDGAETCSNGKDAEIWLLTKTVPESFNQTLQEVQLHIEIEAQFKKCEGKECFKDGFELYRYIGDGEPRVPFNPKDPTLVEKERQKARQYFQSNFTYLGNITGNSTTKERVNTTITLSLKEFRQITFGIKSRGACGEVTRMKVYYYACEERFIKNVMFKETMAPPNGTKTVFGKCSPNSLPAMTNMRDNFTAYCHSNGTWNRKGDGEWCWCDKGYEPIKHGCSICKPNSYKLSRSNEKCVKCGPKTVVKTEGNTTSCKCKDGLFSLPSERKPEKQPRCHAPFKIEKLTVKPVKKDSVNITWHSPDNSKEINETIVYNIRCSICVKTLCNEICTGLAYTPRRNETKETYVYVTGLRVGHKYEFQIFPIIVNSLNKVVSRNNETFTAIRYTAGQTNDNNGQGKGDPNLNTYLVVIVCVACLTLLLVVFLVAFFLRRRKEKKGLFQGLPHDRPGVELPTIGKKTYVDPTNYDRPLDAVCDFATEIDASLLYLEMLIGGGEFGDVYKGSMTVTDGKKVPIAVKTLKKDATPKSEKDFLVEASVMGQFDCPNVVKLEGVVTKYKPWMIVIEFMSNGSLDNFLKANDGRLSHIELINMAKGVAVGMEYLAGMNFVHRDLAARNILVDGNLMCKVSDFGLSRELEATDSSLGEYATTGGKIPIRWTAPEATKYRKFSSASDVWSFGILLWEIMSFSERPYWEWDNLRVMEEVDNGFRLPAPLNCPKGVHDVMMQCWNQERTERPNFTEINTVIDGWIQSPKTMEGDVVDLCAELREWLQSIKMSDYVPNFTATGYQRPCELYAIKEDDLKEMGISLVGHRNKILKGISKLPGNKKGKQPLKKEISLEV